MVNRGKGSWIIKSLRLISIPLYYVNSLFAHLAFSFVFITSSLFSQITLRTDHNLRNRFTIYSLYQITAFGFDSLISTEVSIGGYFVFYIFILCDFRLRGWFLEGMNMLQWLWKILHFLAKIPRVLFYRSRIVDLYEGGFNG